MAWSCDLKEGSEVINSLGEVLQKEIKGDFSEEGSEVVLKEFGACLGGVGTTW